MQIFKKFLFKPRRKSVGNSSEVAKIDIQLLLLLIIIKNLQYLKILN